MPNGVTPLPLMGTRPTVGVLALSAVTALANDAPDPGCGYS